MKKFLAMGLVLTMLAGCGANYEPRAIEPEVDVCEVCNMSIVHEDYATEVILHNGDYHIFDDIGCMVEYKNNTDEDIEVSYVKDMESDEWITSEEATYVYDAAAWTPMSYGVLSFEQQQDAQSYIEKEGTGELMSAEDLKTHHWDVVNQ